MEETSVKRRMRESEMAGYPLSKHTKTRTSTTQHRQQTQHYRQKQKEKQ